MYFRLYLLGTKCECEWLIIKMYSWILNELTHFLHSYPFSTDSEDFHVLTKSKFFTFCSGIHSSALHVIHSSWGSIMHVAHRTYIIIMFITCHEKAEHNECDVFERKPNRHSFLFWMENNNTTFYRRISDTATFFWTIILISTLGFD